MKRRGANAEHVQHRTIGWDSPGPGTRSAQKNNLHHSKNLDGWGASWAGGGGLCPLFGGSFVEIEIKIQVEVINLIENGIISIQ